MAEGLERSAREQEFEQKDIGYLSIGSHLVLSVVDPRFLIIFVHQQQDFSVTSFDFPLTFLICELAISLSSIKRSVVAFL